MTTYDSQFFTHQQGGVRSARKILPVVLSTLRGRRVIDVGCGIGSWARVARDLGCSVTGVDGNWVPHDQLLIASDEFTSVDLASPPEWPHRYDLAISLEVAEHLPHEAAGRFIAFLTSLAPRVLFSAAVPWQRGTGHVNEQYASYWSVLFKERGFDTIDLIRPRFWNDLEVEFFYRQNMFLYVDQRHGEVGVPETPFPLDAVHPDAIPILAQGWFESLGAVEGLALFTRSLKRSIRMRFRGRS